MENSEPRKLQLYQLEAFKEVDRICKKNNINYFMIGGTLIGAVRHKGFIPWDTDLDIAMYREDYNKFAECCEWDLSEKYFYQNYKTDIDYFPSLARICINNTYTEKARSRHLRHHKGIYIDIFPLDNVPDSEGERDTQRKRLSKIDKIKLVKAAYIYSKGFLHWKVVAKRMLKLLLSPIPLKRLQRSRERIMTKYENQKTKYICSTASHYGYQIQVMEREIYGNPVLLEFEGDMYYAPENWHEYLTRLYGDYMKLPPIEKRIPLKAAYEKVIFNELVEAKL